MIGIIDYGMGNLHSVQNALASLGFENIISESPEVLAGCDKLILPGVGAFKDMMDHLKEKELDVFLKQEVENGVPLLGICLGMQAFFQRSFEKGEHKGLGFLKGDVTAMDPQGVTIPQIGWNELEFASSKQASEIADLYTGPVHFYFDHSYMANGLDDEVLVASTAHGNNQVPSIVRKDNLLGIQCHPEKSGEDGLKLLKYFGEKFYEDHSSY